MSAPSCPICKRPADTAAYVPFCSKRCADVDLQHWFTGAYSIPAADPDLGLDEAHEAGRARSDPL